MQNNPIGIFDSGIGGLSVLKELLSLMPNEKYLYFGDTKRVPYGEKTNEQILSYSKEILDWFKTQNVKAVVMACNTSCAISLNPMRKIYDFKIFGLIDPIAKYLASQNYKKIGVIATSATIRNKAYSATISKYNKNIEVIEIPAPGLVEIVEQQKINTKESYKILSDFIEPLKAQKVDKIVLGCTHYPYLKEIIDDICNQDITLDPAEFLSKHINNEILKSTEEGYIKFHSSANTKAFQSSGNTLLPIIKEVHELSFS